MLWRASLQILQRGQEVSEAGQSRSKWRVVRVAIVRLESMVYIGRLFFGDAETGDVVWDCDVRPSDGAVDRHAPVRSPPSMLLAKDAGWVVCQAERPPREHQMNTVLCARWHLAT